MENEAWMSVEIGEELWKLLDKIWRGEGLPEEWRMGIISLIYNRGGKEERKKL